MSIGEKCREYKHRRGSTPADPSSHITPHMLTAGPGGQARTLMKDYTPGWLAGWLYYLFARCNLTVT